MFKQLTLILAAASIAACTSTGDYPGATPAPVAYTAPLPLTETITPFSGQPDWTIQRTPGVLSPLRSYTTNGSSYATQRQLQPGVLPPLRAYNTDGTFVPVLVQ